MLVKKIQKRGPHLANRLHGTQGSAKYGVFRDGVQVGVAWGRGYYWEAFDLATWRPMCPPAGSLKTLREALAAK